MLAAITSFFPATEQGLRSLFPRRSVAPRFIAAIVLLLAFFSGSWVFGAMISTRYPVAMRTFGVWEAGAHERFDFSVWYPGNASQAESVREGWIVEAGKRGRIIPGFYPIILLSHDTASGRFANNDLASSLAAEGFIVIAPTHMGDNQNDSADMYTAHLLRARPRHLLRALETVLDSPDFALFADESRIGLIGVGFGSITVLQLAGAVPDPSVLARLCSSGTSQDAFCASWTAGRLAHLAKDMRQLEKQEGKKAFAPPLALYAPPLAPAPISTAVAPTEPKKPVRETKSRFSLSQMLFGKAEDEAELPDVVEGESAPSAPSGNAPSPGNLTPVLDFQGGPGFGGTDSGDSFVHIALSDSPHFRVTVAEEPSGALTSPDVVSPTTTGLFGHRRPPEIRKILGIALVAPAGGMLFSRESLSSVHVPVALLEAGQNTLYTPSRHAQPFYTRLPVTPELLALAGVDHFSLFARCAKDTMANLGEACGRLVGEARRGVAEQRDAFVGSFFRSVLGAPQAPAFPSGFVAAHHVH